MAASGARVLAVQRPLRALPCLPMETSTAGGMAQEWWGGGVMMGWWGDKEMRGGGQEWWGDGVVGWWGGGVSSGVRSFAVLFCFPLNRHAIGTNILTGENPMPLWNDEGNRTWQFELSSERPTA